MASAQKTTPTALADNQMPGVTSMADVLDALWRYRYAAQRLRARRRFVFFLS
jgi:hypothetical protein